MDGFESDEAYFLMTGSFVNNSGKSVYFTAHHAILARGGFLDNQKYVRVLSYLHRHKHIGLCYEASNAPVSGMTDSDWAVKHSTSGYIFTLAQAAISWSSKRQPTIALSS